ncbi:MAG TPA: CCA tRNA nucleotidyltransferase [Nitrospirae bacterium]|nr:multifunctional CCA protein [bacterium BMS3Abin06]HDH11800.1 CCA tRNA nucleotidyltransferase [Nitrospirota bacterium]HDZ02858.1 CCA tRNA nucleotidyltransferase [Nitrospirota bacterium]
MNLSKKILSDPVNNRVFSNFRKDIFLVGGYLRDLLRGHISKDKDFALKGDIRQIALDAAKKFKGTFIELKKNRTCRVAIRSGEFIDFTFLENNILEDLQKRDFTVNAMAWSPETGLIDPLKGESDLKNRTIKVVNPDNLVDDPLRVLRAYRLAAQLGFSIDNKTRLFLRKYAELIVNVAPERITEELFKLLNNEQAAYLLPLCHKDKVLNKVLGVKHLKFNNNIDLIRKFDRLIIKFKKEKKRKILHLLKENVSQGLIRAGFIRLAILLINARYIDKDHLRLSRKNRKKLRIIQNTYKLSRERITRERLYRLLKEADESVYEAAIVLSTLKGTRANLFLDIADHFIKIKNKRLFTGNEIQEILNIGSGELVGKIKDELEKRIFLGYIRNKPEAREWILSNFT